MINITIVIKCTSGTDLHNVDKIKNSYLLKYPGIKRMTIEFKEGYISVYSKGEKDRINYRIIK